MVAPEHARLSTYGRVPVQPNPLTLGRHVVLAAAGKVTDRAAAVASARQWLTVDRVLLPGAPPAEIDRLDTWAGTVDAWANDRYPVVAGMKRNAWLRDLSDRLAAIDDRVFTAVLALCQAAFVEAVEKVGARAVGDTAGRRKAAAVGDPALLAAMRTIPVADVPGALKQRGVWAAVGVNEREIIRQVTNGLRTKLAAELDAGQTAIETVIADMVGAPAVDITSDAMNVPAAAEWLAGQVAAAAEQRVDTTTGEPAGLFAAGLVWAALALAGGAATNPETGDPVIRDGIVERDNVRTGAAFATGVAVTAAITQALNTVQRLVDGATRRGPAVDAVTAAGWDERLVDPARAVNSGRTELRVVNVWTHVSPPGNRFEPHFDLRGTRSDIGNRALDAKLRNTEEKTAWIDRGQFGPGDHIGCRCWWASRYELHTV